MSWRWRARTNTRWKRSSWRFTRTRPCPKPWPKPRSIRSVEWWTCDRGPEGPLSHRARRPRLRGGTRRRDHHTRATGGEAAAGLAGARPLPRGRGRPAARRIARGGRRGRHIRLAPQPAAGKPVAERRHRRARRSRSAARGIPRRRSGPTARLPRPDRVGLAERRGRHGREPLGDRRRGRWRRGKRHGGRPVTRPVLEVVRAGLVPYAEALEWQRTLAQARIDGRLGTDLLLLLEHPAVVTLGRASDAGHLLRRDGIEVFETERGGDVTFHGPGQLVGYPIIDLSRHKPDLHWYLRTLEQALIDALTGLGIPAERNAGYTGVWTRGRKIASIGIHVKQWVTWHGFALNVANDLADFARIVPCGIPGVEMTSVLKERGAGSRKPLWRESVGAMVKAFETVFGVDSHPEGCARQTLSLRT